MRLKGILITLVIVLGLVFAVINWGTLTAGQSINVFGFYMIVPLGLLLLLTAVGLSLLFFFVSLIDRAGQLRQITHLERELEKLHAKLDSKRLRETETLEQSVSGRLSALETKLGSVAETLESVTRESTSALEMRTKERIDKLEERVLLVRNELAANIAETEYMLKRHGALTNGEADTPALNPPAESSR